MEELFQYMKTLRSQINDVADQAATTSIEEHMQCTTIQTLQKDLDLVKNETRQIEEETAKMSEAKEQICFQILETQKKIASLESDSFTLSQTLELVQQKRLSLSTKLMDQSAYYKKVGEDINGQLKEQQVNEKADGREDIQDDMGHAMMIDTRAAQAKFDKMEQLKSNLVLENTKLRQSVELVKTKITDIKPGLSNMDEKRLEGELQAVLSDKAGESEYLQSLQLQIMRLQEISHTARCSCGEEYTVKLDL